VPRKLLSLENLTMLVVELINWSINFVQWASKVSDCTFHDPHKHYWIFLRAFKYKRNPSMFYEFAVSITNGIITPFFLEMRHCWGIEYPSLPPVTKKYDRRTKAKTTIADGGFTHPGFLSFKLGTSKIWKGIPYKASILNTKRKGTLLYITVIMIGPALRSTIQWKRGFYGSSQLSVVAWGGVLSCSMIGQWIKHRYFQMQTLARHHTLRLQLTDASFRFVYNF